MPPKARKTLTPEQKVARAQAKEVDRERRRGIALRAYEKQGATAACEESGVSRRTVQRWANEEGIRSGYIAPITRPCPSAASYTRGCRCDGCVQANREAQREVKSRRVGRVKTGKGKVHRHGVSGYSNWDCRCEKCRFAWSKYLRARRAAQRKATSKAKTSK